MKYLLLLALPLLLTSCYHDCKVRPVGGGPLRAAETHEDLHVGDTVWIDHGVHTVATRAQEGIPLNRWQGIVVEAEATGITPPANGMHEYQLDITEDSTYIYQQGRLVDVIPFDSTSALTKVMLADNL